MLIGFFSGSRAGRRALRLTMLCGWCLLLAAGCATAPYGRESERDATVRDLAQAVEDRLGPVAAHEAEQVARLVVDRCRHLSMDYRLVRPPWYHNLLVNVGWRERGLCYHWATDLLAELDRHHFATLEFRWGKARAKTAREHNAVVVVRRDGTFASGLVLDPWRRSGRLVWAPVTSDSYLWAEANRETFELLQ